MEDAAVSSFERQLINELFYHSSSLPVQLLKSTDVGRHNLLYLKEIGNGWFGKVRVQPDTSRCFLYMSVLNANRTPLNTSCV